MDFIQCRRRIGILWFSIAGGIFVLLLIKTLLGRHGEQVNAIWTWYFQNTLPSLSLIVGVFVASINKHTEEKITEPFLYRLAFGMSLFYLTIILAIILVAPLTQSSLKDIVDASGMYLAPLQGLVTATLGMFFFKNKDNE